MSKKVCEDCKSIILAYRDAEFDLRSRLKLLAELMLAINPLADFDQENVSEVGYEIDGYLDRLQILHHYFFGVEVANSIEDAVVQSELVKLKARSRHGD